MRIEELLCVGVTVRNLYDAVNLFSDLFETTFEDLDNLRTKTGLKMKRTITEHADRSFEEAPRRGALSPVALRFLETISPNEKEGLRSVAFKVSDLEQAKVEMHEKGIRLLEQANSGGLKRAIFCPDDLHGFRLVLVEYNAPSMLEALSATKKGA